MFGTFLERGLNCRAVVVNGNVLGGAEGQKWKELEKKKPLNGLHKIFLVGKGEGKKWGEGESAERRHLLEKPFAPEELQSLLESICS